MTAAFPLLALLAFLALWYAFLQKRSGGRMWNPFWLAFSTTTVSALFLVAGIIGYTLNRHDRLADGTQWAGGVIWSQVAVGLAVAPFAAFFWRKAIQSIDSARM